MIDPSKTKLTLPMKAVLSVLMLTAGCFSPLLYSSITLISPDSFQLGLSAFMFSWTVMICSFMGGAWIWFLDENWRFK